MMITLPLLREWSACKDGFAWVKKRHPEGLDYADLVAALRADGQHEWARWVVSHAYDAMLKEPDKIGPFIDADVARTIKDCEGSPSLSSGDGSKAASSGNYSKAASSGNYSKAASSGNYTIAMVAGIDGQAMAGENGCLALCWYDGTRNRIAVGYVGEGIKADTWYRADKSGTLVEVSAQLKP